MWWWALILAGVARGEDVTVLDLGPVTADVPPGKQASTRCTAVRSEVKRFDDDVRVIGVAGTLDAPRVLLRRDAVNGIDLVLLDGDRDVKLATRAAGARPLFTHIGATAYLLMLVEHLEPQPLPPPDGAKKKDLKAHEQALAAWRDRPRPPKQLQVEEVLADGLSGKKWAMPVRWLVRDVRGGEKAVHMHVYLPEEGRHAAMTWTPPDGWGDVAAGLPGQLPSMAGGHVGVCAMHTTPTKRVVAWVDGTETLLVEGAQDADCADAVCTDAGCAFAVAVTTQDEHGEGYRIDLSTPWHEGVVPFLAGLDVVHQTHPQTAEQAMTNGFAAGFRAGSGVAWQLDAASADAVIFLPDGTHHFLQAPESGFGFPRYLGGEGGFVAFGTTGGVVERIDGRCTPGG